MDLFKIDPGLAIWTWIVFGITLTILGKFAFPALLSNIKIREKTIAQAINNAVQIEKRLSAIEQEQAEAIKASKAQASEILRQTRNQAENIRKELLEKAEEEAQDILAQTKIKIAEERVAVIQSIKSEIADFVCDASEKVIGKSFVSKDDRDWVKELVEIL
ncbi:MAG: F0F1 ATP synthase subunit B [Candidatus Omnitrophica bacterium]|nr:F0F1 ATP synthase subunit B [Candidatus Omnitrophota bacterium]